MSIKETTRASAKKPSDKLHPWPFLGRSKPFRVSHGKGAWLYTPDGKRVLDGGGGAIVVNVGHGRQAVAAAIHDAALKCSYVVPNWITPEREALVNELQQHWLPGHLSRIHLTCGGSEGNESALKIAVQYQAARGKPEKNKIIARNLSYHGTTITTTDVSGHASRKRGLEPILGSGLTGDTRIETPYPLRCPLGPHHADAADYYLDNLKQVITTVGPENIAALIAEPINGSSGGAITPPSGYWPKAQQILRDNDILLIMDEVMTGFGRTGRKFGCEHYELKPDLLIAGKGLAGGYAAITGVFGTDTIAETIADSPFEVMFHTFASLPQSCAAATTVLQILREESLLEKVTATGEILKNRLNESLGQHPHVAEVRGEGLLVGIEVVQDRETLARFPEERNMTNKIVAHALDNGVFFYPGGTGEARDIICIGAPFIVNDEEVELMVTRLEAAITACTGVH